MNSEAMMTHWNEDAALIAEKLGPPSHVLIGLDFDGTLTPIVPDPADAVLPLATMEVLRRLAALPGVALAFASGRALADITRRLPFEDAFFIGNHGLEIQGPGLAPVPHEASPQRHLVEEMIARMEPRLGRVPGFLLEDKGATLSLHVRKVLPAALPEVEAVIRQVVVENPAFKLQCGHKVLEIVPVDGPTKGAALRQILALLDIAPATALYAGDDTTDETVFEALPEAVTIKVGSEGVSAARWTAADPEDVRTLLEWVHLCRRFLH